MTPQNLKILIITAIVCTFCYAKAQKDRDLGDLALAMDIIDQEYVTKPSRKELYQAAMKGMINSLDPHSGYIPVESLKPFQEVFDQEFGGLGVSLDGPKRLERLTVVSTLFNSPAYRAGLKPGDVILKIDGIDSERSEVDAVTGLLRGREGTQVKLLVERASASEPLVFQITREKIEVESVLGDRRRSDGKWEYQMQEAPELAYLRIELFGEKTTDELKKALQSLNKECQGIILDLRDNTGGLLISATEICDMFLDHGEIVSTRGRDNRIDEVYHAKQGTVVANSIPLVVLVNDFSASASEVVAACLQDRKRAKVVGTRSFGKGSVQNVIPLDAGMAAMRLTTAYYYPPSGRLIHRTPEAKPDGIWGVSPDDGCEVKLDEEVFLSTIERFRQRADPELNGIKDEPNEIPNGIHRDPTIEMDPQLMKAIEALVPN
jgi:carboxyl-terminal processing protease